MKFSIYGDVCETENTVLNIRVGAQRHFCIKIDPYSRTSVKFYDTSIERDFLGYSTEDGEYGDFSFTCSWE